LLASENSKTPNSRFKPRFYVVFCFRVFFLFFFTFLGTRFWRYTASGIVKFRGRAILRVLRRELMDLVKAKGFNEFTSIQQKAFPLILEGRDVLLIAPTGFGKTEAAVLPILSRLLELHEEGEKEGIQLLYITPLTALNRDMLDRLSFWCRLLGLRVGVRHGDTPSSERTRQRDFPPNVLVTTPETLQAVLIAPKLKDSLSNVRFVCVDEVHELVESKRGLQLAAGLARLRLKSPRFQVVGLSATVGNRSEVAEFLSPSCRVVEQSFSRKPEVNVVFPRKGGKALKGVGLGEESRARLSVITDLIESHKRSLVFVNTRYLAESLGSLLSQTRVGKKVAVHHSSLSRDARVETEKEFKKDASGLKAVVCTSSLELGIDIGAIDLVIQFGSPRRVARLLQRVGRSGHRRDLVPKGVVVCNDELDFLEARVIKKKALKNDLEPLFLRSNPLDVAAHQLAGLALDFDRIDLGVALKVLNSCSVFDLSLEELRGVAEQSASAKCVDFDGKTVSKRARTKLYYYENLSTIRDLKKLWVRNAATRRAVGLLDESFVFEYLGEGATFVTRGKAWRVLSVNEEEVVVEPASDLTAAIPEWVGEELPVSFEVASAVEEEFSSESRDSFVKKQLACFKPGGLVVEQGGDWVVVHSFWGLKANEALARVIGAVVDVRGGMRLKPRAYGVLVEARKICAEKVAESLRALNASSAERVLNAALVNTALYRKRFIGVAKAFGIISKKAELSHFSVKRLAAALRDSPAGVETLNEIKHGFLDAGRAINLLDSSRVRVYSGKQSPLSKKFFGFGAFGELVAPTAGPEVLESFKHKLFEKKQGVYCTFCGKTHAVSLYEAPDEPRCPFCKSKRLTLKKFGEAWEKGKPRKEVEQAELVANLVSEYGSRALLALATYGVGPDTAARVLGRMHSNEEDFFFDLLDAQKTFIKTRKFWRI
jgi:ATP-dependent helicase Lhr and Lhr-like helicase